MTTYNVDGDTVDPTIEPKANHYTPNVAIETPKIRRIWNATLSTAGIMVAAAIAVDGASADIDISAITLPAAAGIASLSAAYGLIVTHPNIPTR